MIATFERVGSLIRLSPRVEAEAKVVSALSARLRASAKSASMLSFVDNDSNVKGGPNENYARELLELFTMGVTGPDGSANYTQTDITVDWRSENDRYGVQWFFRNLENERPLTYGSFVSAGPDDIFNWQFGRPFTWGMRLSVDY